MKVSNAIKYLAVERGLEFNLRLEARALIPVGTEADFDFKAHFVGHFRKDPDTEMNAVETTLTPAVLASMARHLRISQKRLGTALAKATGEAIHKGVFDDGGVVHAGDGHLAVIREADAQARAKLKKKKRTGSCRVVCRPRFFDQSVKVLGR